MRVQLPSRSPIYGGVVEKVDTGDSKPPAERHEGALPSTPTIFAAMAEPVDAVVLRTTVREGVRVQVALAVPIESSIMYGTT